MNSEYITKQQAIDYIKSMEVLIGCTGVSVLTKGIEGLEEPYSSWKFNNDGSGTCKKCHRTTVAVWDMDRSMDYCPNCGIKMKK